MKELDGYNIPNLSTTVDGSCASDPAAAADAANRGWWTCGGYTRDTDIVACPDKLTWGVRWVFREFSRVSITDVALMVALMMDRLLIVRNSHAMIMRFY